MKVGDLVWDRLEKSYGILIKKDWFTDIGTPFDWQILYFNGTMAGSDERYMEVVNESR